MTDSSIEKLDEMLCVAGIPHSYTGYPFEKLEYPRKGNERICAIFPDDDDKKVLLEGLLTDIEKAETFYLSTTIEDAFQRISKDYKASTTDRFARMKKRELKYLILDARTDRDEWKRKYLQLLDQSPTGVQKICKERDDLYRESLTRV